MQLHNFAPQGSIGLWDHWRGARCTNFLISRVHDISLWIDQIYSIHVDNIHQLIELSLEGEDVSKGFQGLRNHRKKKGKVILYEKFHTQRGGRTMNIDLIILEIVRTTYYVVVIKVIRS
jgi:hypothetical protein